MTINDLEKIDIRIGFNAMVRIGNKSENLFPVQRYEVSVMDVPVFCSNEMMGEDLMALMYKGAQGVAVLDRETGERMRFVPIPVVIPTE